MSKLYVYLMRSRNKDNKHLEDFHERCMSILEYEENEHKVVKQFHRFAAEGKPGERTRLYKSLNARDEEKVREELIIKLLKEKPSMTKLNNTLASVAQQTENRAENNWMFDFDCDDRTVMMSFIEDIRKIDKTIYPKAYETPNGYAIVVNHGFDTRELMSKYKDYDITLKRDDLLFMDIEEA